MVHDVFISYSKEDKPTADAVCGSLEAAKIRCWIAPRDVLAGMNWGGSIIRAIGECRVMVLVFSSHSNNSQQVLREVERAVNKSVVIVPFRIENVEPSEDMEYYVSAPHWLDAVTPPLSAHLERLRTTVQAILQTLPEKPVKQDFHAAPSTPLPPAPNPPAAVAEVEIPEPKTFVPQPSPSAVVPQSSPRAAVPHDSPRVAVPPVSPGADVARPPASVDPERAPTSAVPERLTKDPPPTRPPGAEVSIWPPSPVVPNKPKWRWIAAMRRLTYGQAMGAAAIALSLLAVVAAEVMKAVGGGDPRALFYGFCFSLAVIPLVGTAFARPFIASSRLGAVLLGCFSAICSGIIAFIALELFVFLTPYSRDVDQYRLVFSFWISAAVPCIAVGLIMAFLKVPKRSGVAKSDSSSPAA